METIDLQWSQRHWPLLAFAEGPGNRRPANDAWQPITPELSQHLPEPPELCSGSRPQPAALSPGAPATAEESLGKQRGGY